MLLLWFSWEFGHSPYDIRRQPTQVLDPEDDEFAFLLALLPFLAIP